MRKNNVALRNALILGGTVIALLIIVWFMATGAA
jgi:hypothetical protein